MQTPKPIGWFGVRLLRKEKNAEEELDNGYFMLCAVVLLF
jgi:hypothetical protein